MKREMIEIPKEEFEELLNRYKICVKEREDLKKINDFLNKQILEYNKKFADNKTNYNFPI